MFLKLSFFRKITAFLTLLALPWDPALPALQAMQIRPESSALLSPLRAVLPPELGTVKERFEGAQAGRCLVIVQDAHAVPDAQRSLQKILEHAARGWGIRFFALEGAASALDTAFFRSYPDENQVRGLIDRHIERGEFSGAAAAALFDETGSYFAGVENSGLYQEGLRLFLAASDQEAALQSRLKVLQDALENEKTEVYTPELLEMDRAVREFRKNTDSLPSLLKMLAAVRRPQAGSRVELLLTEFERSEKKSEQFTGELREAAERMRLFLSENERDRDLRPQMAEFNEKIQGYRNSSLAPESLAAYLGDASVKLGFKIQFSESLEQRIQAHRKMRDLEGTALFDEIEGYIREIMLRLLMNPEQEALEKRSRALELLEKLSRLNVHRSEWRELEQLLRNPKDWQLGGAIPEIQDEGWVRSGFQSAADFYRNTSERDHAILQNIERTMDQRGDAAAVLVAGGFHAESLTFRLKEKGISYVLISPRTDALPGEDLYRRAIRGDVSWKSYFRVKDGKIDLYDAFARAFRDELLEKNPDGRDALLRHWRFNLLRLLAEERRLDQAGAYTRYLDPDREEQTSRKELRPRVEAFVQRLSRMKAGEVTPERILELIRLSRITASASIPFARRDPPLPEEFLRSELRGEGAQERFYEILAQNRDGDFWTWFKKPSQADDYSIFERIVQGDDQELAKLMRVYPGKVYVDRSVKKNNPDFRLPPPQDLENLQAERADQPPVSWWSFLSGYFKRSAAAIPKTVSPNPALPQRLEEPDPSEGLSVYLTLEKSYRGMTVLRLEGVRPRLDQSKRPAEYQAPKSLSFSVTEENAITISRAAPVPKPFGALTLEQALNAAGWLGRVKKNTRGDPLAGLGGSVDEILGVGSFGRAESAPPRLAFLVTGLAGDDARLRSYTRTEETPRAGEKARYLQQTSFRNRKTNQEKDLKDQEELKLALSLGKLVRSFHDAGFYHGELSLRSFGLKEKGGSKDFEQPVLRSLGALLDKAQIPIQDPHLRNEIAARHRWKDVIRLMLEWGRPEYKTTATRLQTEFLAGYLGEAVDEGAVYAALNLTGVYAAIALLISEKDRDKSAPEKTFTSEQLKNLLQPSLSLMRALEQQASQRSELRGEDELLQEWNRRYKTQKGKPDDEPGHLGIQFRGASLESAPGSIAEFDFLKAAARIYEPSLRDALSEEPYAVRKEIVQILEFLKNQQLLTEVHAQAMLRSFDAVEKAAGIYHRDGQLTSVTSKDDFLKNYFEAASLVWKSVPILAEALARRQQPTEKKNAESLDNYLTAQDENGLHFSLEKGFERITRRQIALVPGVDALEYLREDPARVLRLFRQSIDRGLPLSHELRLALLSYLQEFTERLKEESEKDSQSAFFSDIAQNFRDLMASDKNIMPALWEMYRLGVLEALVPELRQVRDIPSNFNVHIFTVGQHTLYNLQKFEDLRSSEKNGLEEGRRIASALDAPGRLQIRLTLLFHDLGKRMVKLPVEPDHAIVASREIVPRRLRELGVEMTAIQNIAWAVRDHMVLNAFARMDDANLSVKLPVLLKTIVLDPEANLQRLKLLYLISLTDRDSVNPWGNLMGPESLTRLNRIYRELEDYLETDPKDRPRSIDDMQRVGHDKTMTQWEAFKSEKSEAIRANLSALDEKGMSGYFKKVPIVPSGTFREVREELLKRAQALSRQNEEDFGRFMDRHLAAFSMERIREFSEEELLERTLFLLHLQMRHEQEDSTPILYFNTGLNRTYERGYEILVGGGDREAFFEGVTGVLLRHGFDIEEADIRTLDGGSVVDTFQGFFRDPYPDEGAHVRMQDSMVNDMGKVFSGTPIGTIFGQAGKPYALEASAPLLSTEAEFLEDAEIYGVPASVFNLKTANRLGLLHALAVILRVKGYNLVSAPVTTHPSRVNDTFFINAGGRHLSLDQKTELAALLKETFDQTSLQFEDLPSLIAPSRSELRTSALERLWPRDLKKEDFETQTLAAWKADWLDEEYTDEDQVTSFLEASREDENKLVIQFKKQDGSTILKNGLNVYLIIHQDSEGNITSLQSHGYPYIRNDEVFRGVLYWLQSHGIDEIRTDLMSDFLTNLARDWNQSRALDRVKPPAVRIRNGAVIFGLNRLNLKGKGGARSELRSAAEGRLGMVFPEREAARIKYQAGWIAGIFPRLSDAQKKVLLYPNLLMTLLGVKPLYMKVEQGSPSPKSLLLPENPQSLFADSRHEFFLDENQLVALLPAAVTILKHRDWLFQQGVFTEVDRDKLGRMENALSNPEDKDKLFQWTYEVMTKVYRDLISGEPENEVKAHRFYGLLFGYSPRDILASEQAAELPRSDPRFIYGRYEGLAVFSPERYPPWMDRAEASIEYAYGLLKDLPGFNEAAREYTRDFPKEVQLELERLYGGDGRSLSPAESELWNAANRVFDGSAQDKQGSAITLQRAKDMLWRLRIRPGDTLADLGAGERGGIGLIAAMLGAHVTAVESREESRRQLLAHSERLSGYIQQMGGSFTLSDADLGAGQTAQTLGKFDHVIITDTVTPSQMTSEFSPSAPPTYEPEKILNIMRTAAGMKNANGGMVLFSVPEYVLDRGRLTAAVPYLDTFVKGMIAESQLVPVSAHFVAVPYSGGIQRGVLYRFQPPSRSELRTSALERLWPRDLKKEDFETQTLAAWKADWLPEESRVAAIKANKNPMTGSISLEFLDAQGKSITHKDRKAEVIIDYQPSDDAIAGPESGGLPGVDSAEMFRGLLNWMKSREIGVVQARVANDFLEKIQRDWNSTRRTDTEAIEPIRWGTGRNWAKMVFELKRLDLEKRATARSELRKAAEAAIQLLETTNSGSGKASGIAEAARRRPEWFAAAVLSALRRAEGEMDRKQTVLSVQAAFDFSQKLLGAADPAQKSGEIASGVTLAVDFAEENRSDFFISALIDRISALGIRANLALDRESHTSFKSQLRLVKKRFAHLFTLERFKPLRPRQKTPGVRSVATALDAAKSQLPLDAAFQGLYFDFKGLREDPDLDLAGQVLFAALLIKLGQISRTLEADSRPEERAERLRRELLSSVQEAGYSLEGLGTLSVDSRGHLRVAGLDLVKNLTDQMTSRTAFSRSA